MSKDVFHKLKAISKVYLSLLLALYLSGVVIGFELDNSGNGSWSKFIRFNLTPVSSNGDSIYRVLIASSDIHSVVRVETLDGLIVATQVFNESLSKYILNNSLRVFTENGQIPYVVTEYVENTLIDLYTRIPPNAKELWIALGNDQAKRSSYENVSLVFHSYLGLYRYNITNASLLRSDVEIKRLNGLAHEGLYDNDYFYLIRIDNPNETKEYECIVYSKKRISNESVIIVRPVIGVKNGNPTFSVLTFSFSIALLDNLSNVDFPLFFKAPIEFHIRGSVTPSQYVMSCFIIRNNTIVWSEDYIENTNMCGYSGNIVIRYNTTHVVFELNGEVIATIPIDYQPFVALSGYAFVQPSSDSFVEIGLKEFVIAPPYTCYEIKDIKLLNECEYITDKRDNATLIELVDERGSLLNLSKFKYIKVNGYIVNNSIISINLNECRNITIEFDGYTHVLDCNLSKHFVQDGKLKIEVPSVKGRVVIVSSEQLDVVVRNANTKAILIADRIDEFDLRYQAYTLTFYVSSVKYDVLTIRNNESVVLGCLRGDNLTIYLDLLRTDRDIAFGETIAISKVYDNLTSITYINPRHDNVKLELKIYDGNTLIFNHTESVNPNIVTLYLPHSYLNLSSDKVYKLVVVAWKLDGTTKEITRYFMLDGRSGLADSKVIAMLSMMTALFGLMLTPTRYGSIVVFLFALGLTALAVVTWYIMLIQVVLLILLIYYVIITIKRESSLR